MAEIPVLQNILEANEAMAAQVRSRLERAGVVALNFIGAPGAGKTSLLEQTLPRLHGRLSVAVIEADCATARDAGRIKALGIEVVQINTGTGCHVPAHLVLQALDRLPLERIQLLIIENVGNLVCPAELDIGESGKIAVISVAEGDDKPQKYPMLFRQCCAVVLNKVDLIPHTDFRRERFEGDLRTINADVPLFGVSCRTGEGVDAWVNWLIGQTTAR
ncbi:MAG: hydrogenase nickel incorporation protein HypB [Candidatus Sumerlaeia bacterium]|nr:hydrogenase nickel incorporation protein HypB [Candidatus Sumerlaeia bacterium]